MKRFGLTIALSALASGIAGCAAGVTSGGSGAMADEEDPTAGLDPIFFTGPDPRNDDGTQAVPDGGTDDAGDNGGGDPGQDPTLGDPGDDSGKGPTALPGSALPVPLVFQAHDYSCGPASLLSTIFYWTNDQNTAESSLYKTLKTDPNNGTDPQNLVAGAQKYGLHAEFKTGQTVDDLRNALSQGITPIVDIQAWSGKPKPVWTKQWDDGHYVVVVALDDQYAYFMDPEGEGGYDWCPIPELQERWHDYLGADSSKNHFMQGTIYISGTTTPIAAYPGALIYMH
jgi:hypothetical protein